MLENSSLSVFLSKILHDLIHLCPFNLAVCSFNISFVFILQCMIQREKRCRGAADNLARPDGAHRSVPQRVVLSLKWDLRSSEQRWNSVAAKPLRSNGPKIRMPRVKHANQLHLKLELKRRWLREKGRRVHTSTYENLDHISPNFCSGLLCFFSSKAESCAAPVCVFTVSYSTGMCWVL